MRRVALLVVLLLGARDARALEWLDAVDRALRYESPNGLVRVDLGGRLDVEGYWIDQQPPGLIFGRDDVAVQPRLVMTLDAWLGRQLYVFVQARADRGFDPLLEEDGDARADEYFLRWTPLTSGVVNLQAGKFATLVGNFVARHDSWQNPFVTAPLVYERVTAVSDYSATGTFFARRNVPDRKRIWLPVIWGPSYASGASVFGRAGMADYGVEVKNAALGARPSEWDAAERDWSEPTVSARIGIRPSSAWALGVSGSSGPYLQSKAAMLLATGDATGDFRESVVGADARFSWRHLELWAEIFASRFEVPIGRTGRVVDADTLSYYLEGRYRILPSLFAALRWNQQMFSDAEAPDGRDIAWDRDAWRVDMALTYRFDRHVQAKIEYDVGRQNGRIQQGEQLVAWQLTIRF